MLHTLAARVGENIWLRRIAYYCWLHLCNTLRNEFIHLFFQKDVLFFRRFKLGGIGGLMFDLHLFFLQLAPPIFHTSYISTDFNFTISGLSNFSPGYLIGVVYKSLVSSIQLLCRKRCQCFLTLSDSVAFSILLVLMILGFERKMLIL